MAEYKNLKVNELLFNQGDPPDNMYIVKSGKIAIFLNVGETTKVVSVVGVGELIGEISLFDKKGRSAGARALSDASLVILPYEVLQRQMDELPDWVKVTMKTLCDKIRDTNQRIVE